MKPVDPKRGMRSYIMWAHVPELTKPVFIPHQYGIIDSLRFRVESGKIKGIYIRDDDGQPWIMDRPWAAAVTYHDLGWMVTPADGFKVTVDLTIPGEMVICTIGNDLPTVEHDDEPPAPVRKYWLRRGNK